MYIFIYYSLKGFCSLYVGSVLPSIVYLFKSTSEIGSLVKYCGSDVYKTCSSGLDGSPIGSICSGITGPYCSPVSSIIPYLESLSTTGVICPFGSGISFPFLYL